MTDSTPEQKTSRRQNGVRAWRVRIRRPEGKLPPPSSGRELSEFLDKAAATLTPEDLADLDRAIKASHESSR